MLSDEQKKQLLRLARTGVKAAVGGEPSPDLTTEDSALLEERGAFVTLRRQGELRGCLGYVEGIKPLIEAVAENAASSALHDPRFAPVTRPEIPELTIEISALTPLTLVETPEDIQVGRHGLMICLGPKRGLLLPQVPGEFGWDREEFLARTCLKAGLPPQSWQDPNAQLFCFEAEVFSEEDFADLS